MGRTTESDRDKRDRLRAELAKIESQIAEDDEYQLRREYERSRKNLQNPAVLEAVAPEHSMPRYDYNERCTDESPTGAQRARREPKEFRCKRCALIEIRDGANEGVVEYHVEIWD